MRGLRSSRACARAKFLRFAGQALDGDVIRVTQRLYKRVLNTPKNGKIREAVMSEGTLSHMRDWAALAQDPAPDGFPFPSEKLSTPLSLDNLWRRCMMPKLKLAGFDWATFQVLRKTNARLSTRAGVDSKVASDKRGDGLGVSLEVYTSSDLEQKRQAVRKLEAAVALKTSTSAPTAARGA